LEKKYIKQKIGNTSIFIDPSHKLPTYYTDFKFYDRVLPKLAKHVKDSDEYLKFIDIGANIGDTVKLVDAEVKGKFLCIEGDSEFLELLNKNVETIKESSVTVVNSYCGDSDEKNDNLKVLSKDGTAKLVFSENTVSNLETKTLDTIISENKDFSNSNILKIDTDGFEINILKGAKKFITTAKPVIHVEFTPEFYTSQNQNPLELISILVEYGYRSSIFYDNFGKVVEMVNLKDTDSINKLISRIDNKEIYYYDILTIHKDTQKRYETLFNKMLIENLNIFTSNELENVKQINELKELNTEREEIQKDLNRKLEEKKTKIDSLKEVLQKQDQEIQKFTVELVNTRLNLSEQSLKNTLLTTEVEQIKASKFWIINTKISKLFNRILPPDSIRREIFIKLAKTIYKLAFSFYNSLKGYKKNISSFFKRTREIKKVLFIGHEYHVAAQSTEFLTDEIGKHFDLTTDVYNESNFLDITNQDNYSIIILFQKLPTPEIYNKIVCRNIIFFPMYDEHAEVGYEYWNQYKGLKVINFSKTIHERLIKWGFDSTYVQYFTPYSKYYKGDLDKAYFRQRVTDINISTVEKLLGTQISKIHLHRAVDPGHTYIKPNKRQEKKYKFTYSDWFPTRAPTQEILKDCGILIASRRREGIGLIFLEAMAMGKAVIAPNEPTTNEYIVDGVNGYLYDMDDPKEVKLENLEKVKQNAYNFVNKGRKKWEKDLKKIIKIINSL
jgi:FkbM family methyltransferase